MPGISGKLHDEDGRAGDFAGSSLVKSLKLVLMGNLSDTLATTTFGSLDHDGETNVLCAFKTLLP